MEVNEIRYRRHSDSELGIRLKTCANEYVDYFRTLNDRGSIGTRSGEGHESRIVRTTWKHKEDDERCKQRGNTKAKQCAMGSCEG